MKKITMRAASSVSAFLALTPFLTGNIMIKLTCLCVAVVLVIGAGPVLARGHNEALNLHVDFVEGSPAGIFVGSEFGGMFMVDESLLLMPDGVHESAFVTFDLTIGPVNWNESLVVSPPQFSILGGMIAGVEVTITETLPAHPDLTLTLPLSLGTWRVDDEMDLSGQPIYGGNFGGTYTLAVVPEPSTLTLAALGLIGLLAYGGRGRRRA